MEADTLLQTGWWAFGHYELISVNAIYGYAPRRGVGHGCKVKFINLKLGVKGGTSIRQEKMLAPILAFITSFRCVNTERTLARMNTARLSSDSLNREH